MSFFEYPFTNLSGYVPYTGATTDVNLNVQILHVDTVRAFSEEGILFQSRGIRDIAKFEYGTVAQKLWSPTDYLMEFNATSYDLQTNYVINANELASAAIAASIGSWGRGENYFQIKYNSGEGDWGKALYMDAAGYIRNPNYIWGGSSDLYFDSPAGYTYFGDINVLTTGVSMYIDTLSGQIVFGNISSGDTFYWDAFGGSIFAYSGINTYSMSSTSLSIVNNARINLEYANSSTNNGDLWQHDLQQQLAGFNGGIEQCFVGCLFTQTADKSVTNTTTETSIFGTGIGGRTLPANFLVIGKDIDIEMSGVYSTVAVTGDTITLRVKYGSTTLATKATTALVTGGTNLFWEAKLKITCRTEGSTGTVQVSGRVIYQIAGAVSVIDEINNAVATSTLNTTTSNLLDVTVQHSAASASNTVKSLVGSVNINN